MLGVGYFWGYRFIDPILALTRGTRALAEGKLDERVTVDSNDEIGQLGLAFNNMADKLVELQEDVRKKERQAMFGRISIGLVHDLSHPIQNIGNSCKLIVKMFDDLEYRENFKRTVERELAQVKRVLDDLRNMARPLPLERFPLDLNKAMTDLVESMQTTAEGAGLTIETEFVFGQLYVEGDLFALNRVYRNLIMNCAAGHAAKRTGRRPNAPRWTIRRSSRCPIPAAAFRRSGWKRSSTTSSRPSGAASGWGWPSRRRSSSSWTATITVASEVGVGSTFTLQLPAHQGAPVDKLAAG